MLQVTWKASFSASCLHALGCMHEGLPIADRQVAAILQPGLQQLLEEFEAAGLDAQQMLPTLIATAGEIDNTRQMVETVLRRLNGPHTVSETTVSHLSACISGIENSLQREFPELVDQLVLRGKPLRQHWEARGPGLLRELGRLTDEGFPPATAHVVLVHPLVGGHGRAHLLSNRITFEAVLANPHHQLPETLRLGWLISQLNIDVPRYGDEVKRQRQPLVAQLATLPAILTAAEIVEWAHYSPEMLTTALECWHLAPFCSVQQREALHQWWQTYLDSHTRWTVALVALDELLAG